ncbi:hypothetical protein NEOLEDRAFT_1109538 [Neolentinus lepideus HHB14362 ss-1]|uniref:Uncharacterized protein n=1 Tax=Neolentinus lepideus HHB14362 ss-1 TaxID=1314782 RepID=A0A165UFT6_9AGAM|nr:hypothetical protein NEOLEDRAFT_1109538 [Neolentinus lepideus HHB14362 ss-1]
MDQSENQQQDPALAQSTQTNQGNGDMLDKGVDYLEKEGGHEQSHSTTEKISDGMRKGFTKMTGKNVPIQDKEYN